MNQPTISIVVPVYKAERYLPHTIESLKCQTSKDFEVIFVDDGSPDQSAALISDLMQDSNLCWRLIRQENRGLGGARNTGFHEARGQWLLFLDADDTLQPYAVEAYTDTTRRFPHVDAVFSRYWNVGEEEALKPAPYDPRTELATRETLLRGFLTRKMVFLVPGSLYRMEYLRSNGVVHTTIPWSEDQYFMWQVLNRLKTAAVSRAVMYNYVHHTGESIMNATPLSKILIAYDQYCRLPEEITDSQVSKYLLPRWCLGCLHVFAHRRDKASFDAFWEATTFSSQCKLLLTFPSWNIRILAAAGILCRPLLFYVMR